MDPWTYLLRPSLFQASWRMLALASHDSCSRISGTLLTLIRVFGGSMAAWPLNLFSAKASKEPPSELGSPYCSDPDCQYCKELRKFQDNKIGGKPMLVIVGITKLDNGRIQVAVARPQHNSRSVRDYPSEQEARNVLRELGLEGETISEYLIRMHPLSPNQELKFSPADIAQHQLLLHGFKM
jgi:hypothetical protein